MSALAEIADAGVIAVIRATSARAAVEAGEALLRGGVRALELTFTTPGAPEAIAALHGRALVGAGTITAPGQAEAAVAAGARFLVSPGCDEPVVAEMVATGATVLAGVFTAGELMRARRLGAGAVKLFPAGLGGDGLPRALREPCPEVPIVPTGGVTPGNLAEWLAAGALAVGAGGALVPRGADAEEIERRAAAFTAALRSARATARSSRG
jgi:2-dehydro-3-deoxyphosphogluconate aldolase/(4S)-4-hydroxy-2-oxoglutarate aldolase